MILYLDASAVVALTLADDAATAVNTLIERAERRPLISDFGWGELVSATARRVRARALRRNRAQSTLAQAAALFPLHLRVLVATADIALASSMLGNFDLALKLPDAIHLAIAHRLAATLVSTDQQQVAAARALTIPCINPLEVVR